MTNQEKVKRIEQEIKEMYEAGEIQELLKSDLDVDTLKFLATIKDYYIQQQQKEIIARSKFEI